MKAYKTSKQYHVNFQGWETGKRFSLQEISLLYENQQENVYEKISKITWEGNHTESRQLSPHIIVITHGQDLCMEAILSHPLGSLHIAWSTPQGLLRKTNNATLATALQKNVYIKISSSN